MSVVLSADSSDEALRSGIRHLLQFGSKASPRGMDTLECLGITFDIATPTRRDIVSPVRCINPAFAWAETIWILLGSQEEWIYEYNGALRKFHDPDGRVGVYGPRLRNWPGVGDQLRILIDQLTTDPESRRAVVTIYDTSADAGRNIDIPCTLSHRFMIRENLLHMFTTMRSQDAWLGLPYDLFFGSVLHELVAHWLKIPCGPRHHTIDSFHLYENNREKAELFIAEESALSCNDAGLLDLHVPFENFDNTLLSVIRGEAVEYSGWQHVSDALKMYRAHKRGDYESARQMLLALPEPLQSSFIAWFGRNDQKERRFP